jgi:hypothetical protein
MYPKFIGIGAQKAGTTWLHRNLQDHPQIWMPRKEVHYFDRKTNDRSNAVTRIFGRNSTAKQWRKQVRHWTKRHLITNPSLQELLWDFKFYMRRYNDDWYASIFEPDKGRVTGEITPAYSALKPEKVAHIHELMPDSKLIFMMRNPIERVWSQAVMSFDKVEKGSAKSVPQEELFRRLERDSARLLTNYQRTLETWSSYYPPEQIFVGFLEDVHFHPEDLLQSIFAFLGVDPSFRARSPQKKVHSRSVGRMPARFATHLAKSYKEEMGWLEERFGGYASFWAYCGRRLAEEPPQEDEIAYPLYEGVMWDEWESSGAISLQSGLLSSVGAVR